MPFLSQEDEELKKEQGAPQVSGQSTVLNAPQAAQKPGAPASSGQFKNLQTYLEANKPQAQQMGQKVIGAAEESAKEAQQKQQQFTAIKPTETQAQTQESIKSFYEGPTNKEQYQALKQTGGYTGPQSYLETPEWQEAQKSTQQASEKIGQLQNQTGFERAVAQQYARPQYGAGAQRLDAALIRGEQQSKQAAEQAYQKWGNLTNLLNQSIDPVQQQIAQNLQTAQANRELIPRVESQYVEDIYSPIAQRAAEISASNRERINQMQQDLTGFDFDSKRLSELGLSAGDVLYGTSLSNYLNVNPYASDLKARDVATQSEREKWSNLMNLIGGQDDRIRDTGASISPYEFNKAGFQQARAENQQRYENVAKNQPASSSITLDPGSSGLGLPDTLKQAMGTMNLEELANAIQTGSIPTGYGGAFTPNSGFGKQIMDQYNMIRNTFGANQIINVGDTGIVPTYTSPITGGLKG